MMTSSVARKAPPNLGPSGRRLWDEVMGVYAPRPDEVLLLEKACRTADEAARLDEAARVAPLLTRGSMGQERVNPLLAEARATRALLATLLKSLALTDVEDDAGRPAGASPMSLTSVRAMKAARARWAGSGRSA